VEQKSYLLSNRRQANMLRKRGDEKMFKVHMVRRRVESGPFQGLVVGDEVTKEVTEGTQ
jgi:hypothetical protein